MSPATGRGGPRGSGWIKAPDFLDVSELQGYRMPVESGLQSALNRHTVRPFTESDDTRGCNNTICPPEDEQGTARNMLRIIM